MEITVEMQNGKEIKCVLRDFFHVPDLSYNIFIVLPKQQKEELQSCLMILNVASLTRSKN